MLVSRVFSQISEKPLNQYRFLLYSQQKSQPHFSNNFHSLSELYNKLVPSHVNPSCHSACSTSAIQRLWYSSSAFAQPFDKDQSGNGRESIANNDGKEGDLDLSFDDLVKLVTEKEELLKMKHKEIEKMQDKILRTYAEMENVMDRTKREAENSKKFAIQNFAKGLLDVADNLGRASSVVKDRSSKIDSSKDTAGAMPLLKTLLQGVEMTEKQLAEVFKKFGVEKFDPLNEPFDPNRHHALFEIPDASKPPGTIAAVMKPGYQLYDRVIRPAEVGVTQAVDS